MKIKQSETFCVDLTYVEIRAIYKLIGATSSAKRRADMHLTEDEDKAAESIYDAIHKFLDLED